MAYGSKNHKAPGRPKVSREITDLMIRFKKENPRWGCTRIRDYLAHLGYLTMIQLKLGVLKAGEVRV